MSEVAARRRRGDRGSRTAPAQRKQPTSQGDGRASCPPDDEKTQGPPGDPAAVARIVCLRLLDRRARSRHELEQALAKREVPDDVARTVLDRFAEVGLIDDDALAHAVAGAQHRERGLARRAVAQKLRQRGFDAEVIGDALTEIDGHDERMRAPQLVARRHRSLSGLPVDVRTRRLIGLLARKGYPAGLAWEVVRAELAEHGDAASADMSRADMPLD